MRLLLLWILLPLHLRTRDLLSLIGLPVDSGMANGLTHDMAISRDLSIGTNGLQTKLLLLLLLGMWMLVPDKDALLRPVRVRDDLLLDSGR